MDGYLIAWLVVAGGAVGVAVALFALLRRSHVLVRRLLIAAALAIMLLPAPVPGYAEQLAPAFVVCVFEAFFQIDGSPGQSLRVLLIGVAAVLLLTALGHYLILRYYARSASD